MIFYDRKIGGLYVFMDGIFIFIITVCTHAHLFLIMLLMSTVDSLRVFDTLKMS